MIRCRRKAIKDGFHEYQLAPCLELRRGVKLAPRAELGAAKCTRSG